MQLVAREPSLDPCGVELLEGSPELERVVDGSLSLDESLAAGVGVGEGRLVLLLARRGGRLSCLLLGLLRLLGGLLPLGLLFRCWLSVGVRAIRNSQSFSTVMLGSSDTLM